MLILNIGQQVTEIFGSTKDDLTPLQMALRAAVIFILALVILRIAGIRSFGSKSAFDIVLSITLGAVMGRAITGHYSFFGCVIAATVLASLHRLIGLGAFYNKKFNKIINGNADVIYKNDSIQWKEMQRHSLTEEDLVHAVHRECLASLKDVREAFFETNGKITVVKKEKI